MWPYISVCVRRVKKKYRFVASEAALGEVGTIDGLVSDLAASEAPHLFQENIAIFG